MNFQYITLLDFPLSIMTDGLLAFALLSFWIKRHYTVWGTFFALATVCGIVDGRLQWPALLFVFVFALFCYFTFHARYLTLKITCGLFVFIFSNLLWYHKIPGFSNWQIVNGALLSQDALPVSIHFLLFTYPGLAKSF